MNDQKIREMLDTLNITYEYHHFKKGVQTPFLLYVEDAPKVIYADGESYYTIRNFIFEVYTDSKDAEIIDRVKQMFNNRNIRFKNDEDWIEKESLFVFTFRVQL